MITLSLLSLAALWIALLHRYPAYFIPRNRKPIGRAQAGPHLGENWIEVLPTPNHHEAPEMQGVA